jgi:hypothetical protein
MGKKLTYAIKDGHLVNISKVPNGDKCGCICPSCEEHLIARANISTKRYKKLPHFAHPSKPDCPGAYESAIHLLAKEVLLETKRMQSPDYHSDYNPKNENSKFCEISSELIFDDIELEKRRIESSDIIVVDGIGKIGNSEYFIEFANTHFIDEEKLNKIKNSNDLCIEVNLLDLPLDKDKIKEFFSQKSNNIYWIYNRSLDFEYEVYLEDLATKKKKAEEEKKQIELRKKEKELKIYLNKKDRNIKLLVVTGLARFDWTVS